MKEFDDGSDLEGLVYRFGGTGNDVIHDVIKVDDGLVIVGQSNSVDGDFKGINNGDSRYDDWSNAYIMKINLNKELEWIKVYGSSEVGTYDTFNHIFEYGDRYTVFGGSNSASGDFKEVFSFKAELDSRGELVSLTPLPDDLMSNFLHSSQYNFIDKVDGCCYLAMLNYNLFYIDETLRITFSRSYADINRYGGMSRISGLSLTDGFLIAGDTNSNAGIFEGLNPDLLGYDAKNVFLMKTDREGEIMWLHTYGGREKDEFITLVKGSNNNYIIAGNNQTNDGDFEGYGGEFQRDINQIFIISVNESGKTEWVKTFVGSEEQFLDNLIITPDGGYLLSGYSLSFDGDFIDAGRGFNFIMKVDQNGNKEWVRKFTIPKVSGIGVYSEPIKAMISMRNSYLMVFETSGGKQIVSIEVDLNGNFVE